MPKGAKVLKDFLSHKEKLKNAASSVKLSEECLAVIQKSLPQKEGDPGSFMLPCLIQPLAVKNALADLGTNFVFLEIDEDELVPNILGRPFLATARAVIDVHEGKLSLRVGNETVTFNIGKYMKSKYSRDDYLYCADHTTTIIQEQWVDTVDHDGEWMEAEERRDSNELKELPEHLKYAFLQEDNQLLVVISSALSATEKASLLEVLRNHKGAIVWSIANIKETDIREKDKKSSKNRQNQARSGKAWKSQSQIEAKVNKSQSQLRQSQQSKPMPEMKNT
ncbi:hypothetical protein Tco_0839765 [Tanacetum coccineum]|uniref:Uncharacterized protein n=1 Tax=Tanacetum coccineum TaxID=301880 RepID=A0ABQ5ASG4_9ASTR